MSRSAFAMFEWRKGCVALTLHAISTPESLQKFLQPENRDRFTGGNEENESGTVGQRRLELVGAALLTVEPFVPSFPLFVSVKTNSAFGFSLHGSLLHLPEKPGTGEAPKPLRGAERYVQFSRRLLSRQPDKETELDHLRSARVNRCQAIERLV